MDGCRYLMKSFNCIQYHSMQKFKYCKNILVKLCCLLFEDDICYNIYNFLASDYYLEQIVSKKLLL